MELITIIKLVLIVLIGLLLAMVWLYGRLTAGRSPLFPFAFGLLFGGMGGVLVLGLILNNDYVWNFLIAATNCEGILRGFIGGLIVLAVGIVIDLVHGKEKVEDGG